MLQAACCNHPNPLNILEESIVAALELFATDERQQTIFIIINERCEYVGEFAPVIERLREVRRNVGSLFTGLLAIAERRGELSGEWTASTAAAVLLALVGGLLNEWLRSEKSFDLVACGGKAVHTMLRSLRAGTGAAGKAV